MVRFAATVSKGWLAEVLGVRFDRDYYLDPVRRQAIDRQCNAYLQDHFSELGLFSTESNLGRLAYYEPDQVLIGGIQPNMILGMLVGAEFRPADDRDADIAPTPLAGRGIQDLPPPASLLSHPLIRQFDDQFRELANAPSPRCVPVPPLFWDISGRVAIHGTLTTAQKLFGESIFIDMVTDPARVTDIIEWITETWIILVGHFAGLGRRAITEIHVGECSGCMVRGRQFEQFVIPSLLRFGRTIAPVRLHSCGNSNHLLEAFQAIENLGSLDLGGDTSLARVRELWGDNLPVDIAPRVDDLVASRPAGLLGWADRVLTENGEGPLTIVLHLEPGYPLDNVRALWEHILRSNSAP